MDTEGERLKCVCVCETCRIVSKLASRVVTTSMRREVLLVTGERAVVDRDNGHQMGRAERRGRTFGQPL